ncbi:MAG: hypothetical protein Q4E37_03960 [Tissierellia bacterium]|nr:hypothetical protein [Tissierellia bacterium]
MINKLRDRFLKFMVGRYGTDSLNRAIVGLVFVLLLLGLYTRMRIFQTLALALLVYTYFRAFSRNISRRYQENQKFLRTLAPLKGKFYRLRARFRDRKTHKYVSCPLCKKDMRVPKGKGRIKITCHYCGHEFIDRS